MSPPAKIPAWPDIMSCPTTTTPSSTTSPGTPSRSERSVSCPSARITESASSSSSFAGGLREAAVVELHPLDDEPSVVNLFDGREPLHQHALVLRLLDLEVVRRHPLARPPVDDDRLLGAESLRGPRGVDGRVPASVDDDTPAETRRVLALHAAEQRHGVEHLRRRSRRDVRTLAEVRADREEGCVERALLHRLDDARHLVIQLDRHAERDDPVDLRVEDVPAAAGSAGCRSASSRPASARRRRRSPSARGGRGGRRRRARTALPRRP